MNGSQEDQTVIAQRLHVATGFLSSERDWIVRRLAALGSRLRSFPDTQVGTATAPGGPRGRA